MEVHWFIPGHGGWIPPLELSPAWERYLRAQQTEPFVACLEYGKNGETTKANVEGDRIEYDKSVEEGRLGCRGARDKYHSVAEVGETAKEIAPLSIPVKTLFPSDADQPGETMLVLSGEVKVTPSEAGRYTVFFNMEVSQYPGAKLGDPSRLYVRPNIDERASTLRAVFSAHMGEKFPLEKLLGMEIQIEGGSDGVSLEQASMDVISENGRILARVSFPVYVTKA